jgi:hypothetical protein
MESWPVRERVFDRPPSAGASRPGTTQGLPEIELYTLDDIPLAYLPTAGQTTLSISFGVGRAHEPMIRGGLTHIAEHLVLNQVTGAFDHSNGTTEPFRVTFLTRGTPRQASQFLRDVCAGIRRPPLLRMHEEANVLRTEAAGRGTAMGFSFRLTWLRTGYRGIGSTILPELFLRAPDESLLRTWIAEHLVAGNAQIWIAGELPDDLEVDLPPGEPSPVPPLESIPGLKTPTLYVEDAPGVGIGLVGPRTLAVATALRVLDRRLKQSLRVARGLTYEVGVEYLPVGPETAVANVWTTCLPPAVRDVQRIVLEAVDDMANRGATEDELDAQYEGLIRQVEDPLAAPARLDAHARDAHFGAPPITIADLADQQWRLRSEQTADAFRQVRDSMLLVLPPGADIPQRRFEPYPSPDGFPIARGKSFDFVGGKARPWSRPAVDARLTIGEQGIAIDEIRGNRLVGIRWQECVAVIQEPDARSVLGIDGAGVTLAATDWRDGKAALTLVDRLAPPDKLVPPGP